MNLHKIRMLRGKVIAGTPTRTVVKNQILTIDLDDPKQKDLHHLVELAKTDARHMGRNLCEYVVEGPTMTFTGAELAIIKLSPVSAFPEIAAALAKQLDTSRENAALMLAQALEVSVDLFLGSAPAAEPEFEVSPVAEPEPSGYRFSEREIESLRDAGPEDYFQAAKGFADFRGITIDEAAAEIAAAVGHPWPINIEPVADAAPAPATPEPKPGKKASGK